MSPPTTRTDPAHLTPILDTPRLRLLPVTLEHAQRLQHYFSNWNIIRYLSKQVPWPYPEDGVRNFLCQLILPAMEAGRVLCWALTEKNGTGEPIGLLEVRLPPAEDNRGFWLAEPFQGRGYMTEAVTHVQDFLFFELGLAQIHVLNSRSNSRSRRVKEKTGARFVGEIQAEHHTGDTTTERWVITRESWAQLRRPQS